MSQNLRLPGIRTCPGCGAALGERYIWECVDRNTIVYGSGVCANAALMNVMLPRFTLHYSGVAAGATGIVNALEIKGRDHIRVIAINGDGAIGDIGFAKLSAAAQRNDNFIQFCIDNEAYMNTGIQQDHLTPFGAWTTTSPTGKVGWKKNVPLIMAYHYIPYVATASIAFPQDFKRKIAKALAMKGFRYIHLITPCPIGWGFPEAETVEMARLGVETRIWPLYEITEGSVNITYTPKKQIPVGDYLRRQRRFRHLNPEQIEIIQARVDEEWEKLQAIKRI